IQVRDLAIQERDNDLVLATLCRGFYILDDYRAPRPASQAPIRKQPPLFPVRDAWMFMPSAPKGGREKGFFGDRFFNAPNPPFGAVFTYYLKDELKSAKKTRLDAEKEKQKKGEDTPYPSWDALKAEDREEDPVVILTVTDEDGGVVRRLTGPVTAGFNRVAWDLGYPQVAPTSLTPPDVDPWDRIPTGPLAAPGRYRVSLAKRVGGVE